MVKAVTFAVPGDLATPTGGYAYDRHIIAELRALGWRVEVLDLGEGFPRRRRKCVRLPACALAGVPQGRLVVVDGLALGVLPEAAAALQRSHSLVALVHHPLALETGLAAGEAKALRASERAALACARRVIVTSPATARVLAADFGVPTDRLHVVEPGTDRVPRYGSGPLQQVASRRSSASAPSFPARATMSWLPRWRRSPICPGGWSSSATATAPANTAKLDRDIARHRLAHRISFIGAVAPERLSRILCGRPTFLCCRRGLKATAWLTPRRSRMDCR